MVYTVTLSNKLQIEGTADHLLQDENGEFVQIKDSLGHKIKVLSNGSHMCVDGDTDDIAEMLGWIHGDGWYSSTLGISFNKLDGDYEIKDRILSAFIEYFNVTNHPLKDDDISYQLQTDKFYAMDKAEQLGMFKGRVRERRLPTVFYAWSDNEQRSFMRGLFTADGTIDGKNKRQVYYSTSSKLFAQEIQKYLASIGIHSTIYETNFKTVKRKSQYKLAITKESAVLFMTTIGFSSKFKNDKFNWNGPKYNDEKSYEVISIEEKGVETVYDIIDVKTVNTFYANGIAVHNCNLGSINISEFVVNPYTENASFDMEDFKHAVKVSIIALDEVLNEGMKLHALENQRRMAHDYRNVGLGVMGIADMLVKLGITYGSKEAIDLLDKIGYEMFRTAVFTSNELAKIYGTYPKYKEVIFDSEIMKNHFSEEELKELRKYGLRNNSLLSVAPTGLN